MIRETPGGKSLWAFVPALLLGSMLVGLATLVAIAVDDPHFALEPSYYDKAVHWDRSRAEAAESRALGLELKLADALYRAADGSITLELRVADRAREVFAGGTVEVEAIPNAYATQAQRISLREVAPGVYRGELKHGVLGLWELRVSVARGTQRFRDSLRRDVLKGGAA